MAEGCTLPPCGEPETVVHHEDKVCTVMDCRTCRVPMAVLKEHRSEPTSLERAYMRGVLHRMFPERNIDETMRSMPQHFHMHAR